MCSIIAGYDPKMLESLVALNQHRGNFSHSYTELNKDNLPLNQTQSFGPFNQGMIKGVNYKVCHVQAPTGGMVKDISRVHPVMDGLDMLWHNGLITPRGIKFLQGKMNTTETFDTKLLFDAIQKFGFSILSDIEGLFSCMMLKDKELLVFRTKHGKLYVDDNLSISSERFNGSKCINADTIYSLNHDLITVKDTFKTKRFNFVVPGEF